MELYRLGLVFVFHSPIALAQATGTFSPTGNLSSPRAFHTATLLTNGKVLIAGGFASDCNALVRAELYDPSTGTFSATGDMITARHFHTATLLPNGKVLIAGGVPQTGSPGTCSASPLTSAELYDPATGTFSAAGDMISARWLATATLLDNGKVLIAGGLDGRDAYDLVYVRKAELYDPSAGIFIAAGDLTEPGAETATLLPNGKVLLTRSFNFGDRNHAEIYDPANGAFTRTADMAGPYQGVRPAATLLTNGKVLIAGGSRGDLGGSAIAQLYDPASGAFSVTGEMTAGIDEWLTAALLPDGNVLITGRNVHGCLAIPGVCIGTAELYDAVTGTFSAPSDSQSAEGHAATLLPDGTVLFSGGWVCCGYTINTAEIYRPAVLAPSPVLFSRAGGLQGAILHADSHEAVSAANPASGGEAVEIYLTGLVHGSVIPPKVAIGGRAAEVLWFGNAPGFSNLNQVNVRVPGGVAQGPAVPVRLNYLGRPSNEVILAVQ